MVLHHEYLPYEVRMTACRLFAGRTGFASEEMCTFFREEIQKVVPEPTGTSDAGTFWGRLGNAMESMSYMQKLRPTSFPTRAKEFDYWLSLLPQWRQKELLLELCRKLDFPMGRGQPSQQQRDRLARMLIELVIEPQVSGALQRLDSVSVMRTWEKMMHRCESDPEGAITAARSLLESICKHLLDALGCSYDGNVPLPVLYTLLARELQIAPNQQSEQALTQIYGGIQDIVEGLGRLRNQLGDAHGRGRAGAEPAVFHAAYAVNVAGATAALLVQTWEARQQTLLPAGGVS